MDLNLSIARSVACHLRDTYFAAVSEMKNEEIIEMAKHSPDWPCYVWPKDFITFARLIAAKQRGEYVRKLGSLGARCLSEYDCIEKGIDFAAYERGVSDAIEAAAILTQED
jgi:hypothetical protein